MELPWYQQLFGVYLLLATLLILVLWIQYHNSDLVMPQIIPYITVLIVLWGIWLESSLGLMVGIVFRIVVEKYYLAHQVHPRYIIPPRRNE
jgi:hypothetical protein